MSEQERELTVEAVKEKMREFRRSEAKFYRRYGGGPSIRYDLLDDEGRRYPLASIVQAALGKEDVRGGVKGADSAGRMLLDLAFRVVEKGVRLPLRNEPDEDALKAIEQIADTERDGTRSVRVGAQALRKYVLAHKVRCEVSGLPDRALLRVSHIVAWSDDKESRLDPENVILLSALWDQAFDRGLVTFSGEGIALFSSRLSKRSKEALRATETYSISMTERRRSYLAQHRTKHGFE